MTIGHGGVGRSFDVGVCNRRALTTETPFIGDQALGRVMTVTRTTTSTMSTTTSARTTAPRPPRSAAMTPAQRVVSGGLVTLIGVNTLAPVWAPAVIPQPEGLARDFVENLLQQAGTATTRSNNVVAVRAAALSAQSRDASAIFADVDARLKAVDHRAGIPTGTTRAAVLERALVSAGVEAPLAQAVAHGSARAEHARRGVLAIDAAVRDGRLDPAVLLLGGASLVDRLSSDVRLEAAFVLGFALAPHLSASARAVAEAAVHVGQGALAAAQRHQAAIEHLKHPGTGHAAIDAAGAMAGTVADVVATGLAFFGPGPALGVLRGGEPALVLAQFLATKTAIAGTEKTLATYSTVPEDAAALVAGFVAGAAAHVSVDDSQAEARATVEHVKTSGRHLADALDSGDLRAVHQALNDAVATATPAEKALWAHVLQSTIERTAAVGFSAV